MDEITDPCMRLALALDIARSLRDISSSSTSFGVVHHNNHQQPRTRKTLRRRPIEVGRGDLLDLGLRRPSRRPPLVRKTSATMLRRRQLLNLNLVVSGVPNNINNCNENRLLGHRGPELVVAPRWWQRKTTMIVRRTSSRPGALDPTRHCPDTQLLETT